MRKFLDVGRVIEVILRDRHDELERRDVAVEIETGIRCSHLISDDTVSEVVSGLIDHLMAGSPTGGSIRVGWFPTSNGARVIYLTNAGATPRDEDLPMDPTVAAPSHEDPPSGAIGALRTRVEREGGRLWSEASKPGRFTHFVLFGENEQTAASE